MCPRERVHAYVCLGIENIAFSEVFDFWQRRAFCLFVLGFMASLIEESNAAQQTYCAPVHQLEDDLANNLPCKINVDKVFCFCLSCKALSCALFGKWIN